MRCLALGQAWHAAGGTVTFAMQPGAPGVEARVQAEGMAVAHIASAPGSPADAAETAALAGALGAAHAVLDGYHFGAAMQRALKAAGLTLLVLDDNRDAEYYSADLVLNQNVYAVEDMYVRREPTTRLLLGSDYALLRREFWPWRGWQRGTTALGRRVLVTLGGGDPANLTGRVLAALNAVPRELAITAVIGASNPHRPALEALAAGSAHEVSLVQNVADMPERMIDSDLAISAAGSTVWEMAFTGLPALLIVVADNQRRAAAALAERGVARSLGWHENITEADIAQEAAVLLRDAAQRAGMSRAGQALVDGRGTHRVLAALCWGC